LGMVWRDRFAGGGRNCFCITPIKDEWINHLIQVTTIQIRLNASA
jgi:hypothetical protein